MTLTSNSNNMHRYIYFYNMLITCECTNFIKRIQIHVYDIWDFRASGWVWGLRMHVIGLYFGVRIRPKKLWWEFIENDSLFTSRLSKNESNCGIFWSTITHLVSRRIYETWRADRLWKHTRNKREEDKIWWLWQPIDIMNY